MNLTAYLAQAARADRYLRAIESVAIEMGIPMFQDEIIFESESQYDEFFSRVNNTMNQEPAK